MWLSVLKAVLSLADSLASYANKKQLLDAGAAIAIKEVLEDAKDKVNKAIAARNAVVHDDDSVSGDENNLDRH